MIPKVLNGILDQSIFPDIWAFNPYTHIHFVVKMMEETDQSRSYVMGPFSTMAENKFSTGGHAVYGGFIK